jgi:hypothetical protein
MATSKVVIQAKVGAGYTSVKKIPVASAMTIFVLKF